MMIGYLVSAATAAVICTLFWLGTGGSVIWAIPVYIMSGNLMLVTLISLAAFKSRSADFFR